MSFTTEPADIPKLITLMTSNITSTTATGGGNLINDNGSSIISIGVCWSTSPNPTILDNKTSEATEIGEFVSPVAGLTPLTTYYLRAYTTSDLRTTYENEDSFTTSSTDSSITDIDGNIYSTISIGNKLLKKITLRFIQVLVTIMLFIISIALGAGII